MKKYFTQAYKNFVFRLSARNSVIFIFFYRYLFNPKKGTLGYFYNQVSQNLDRPFVIQVGANDGINHDPIHKYVKRDKWRGLLIEPQPDVFRHQLFPLYMRDEGVYMENIAISDKISLMDMYKISFTRERWATGLTTFHKPTLQDKVDRGDIDIIAKRKGIKVPASREEYIDEVKVESKTFDFLRAKYQIQEVDVLQIDVEGFDFEVIKLYDLNQHKPKVIVFESRHLGDEEYAEAEQYFTKNGFLIKRVKGDSVAVRKDYSVGMELMKMFE
ncbi:FkbM family methyltransferase [Marivirga salinae]|uniref:FkbM family methyltransferase n=1 Tax=Marivirga salinarum TaxID=3059078 RepID=A0AA51NBG6_9BACT|nr:FkbM family methyltransferase [Marivirga sp. BDSF4-3]WMN11934.1 FkbM family methyltransferase [Marivirga sp. BDSF4-3]